MSIASASAAIYIYYPYKSDLNNESLYRYSGDSVELCNIIDDTKFIDRPYYVMRPGSWIDIDIHDISLMAQI